MTGQEYDELIATAKRGRPGRTKTPPSTAEMRVLTAAAVNRMIARRLVEANASVRSTRRP